MIVFTSGNILHSSATALCNPVNCVGAQGVGLARQFADTYPEMNEVYMEACSGFGVPNIYPDGVKYQRLVPGKLHIYYYTEHTIVNFPTKYHWMDPSRLDYISNGLHTLADWLRQQPTLSIALPKLGCGLGGLEWFRVRRIMTHNLANLNNEIYIYGKEKD